MNTSASVHVMTTTTTNSLEWGAAGIPPRARALQVVEDRQERISRIQRNLEQGRETLGAWRDATQFLGDRAGHLMDRQGASAHSTIQYFEGRLQTLTASRAAIQRQLISALRRLATLPPDPEPITLTTGYIREQLKNCPHLTGRIGLAPSRRQVTWNLSGIVMRPHGQLPQGITVDEGAQPEVLLGDVRVQLRLPTSSRGAEIQLRPRSPEAGRPNTFVGDAPHPHVLSNYQPCWGDWGGPITEALHARDIGLVNDLIKTFLGQAYSEDIAGRHWVQWIPGYVVGRRYHYSAVGGWGRSLMQRRPPTPIPIPIPIPTARTTKFTRHLPVQDYPSLANYTPDSRRTLCPQC